MKQTSAFTLVELLVTIGILAVLISLAVPGVMSVRNSQKKTESLQMVNQLHQALGIYAMNDPRGKYPNPDPANGILASSGIGLLLETTAGYIVPRNRLIATSGGQCVSDAWGRYIRYAPDLSIDTVITKPAPRPDWNPKGKEPYPYAYSLGNPIRGEEEDALPTYASQWLYHAETQ